MRKVDLYVYGNIISRNDIRWHPDGESYFIEPDTNLDLSEAIIVQGDMVVDDIYFGKKIVCCSGDMQAFGTSIPTLDINEIHNADNGHPV